MTRPVRPSDVAPVSLAAVATAVGASPPDVDVVVTGVSAASAAVRAGDLYVGVPGARTHGARFTEDAAAAGAVAILTDAAGTVLTAGVSLPVLVVEKPRQVLGEVSALVYGRPAESLRLIGVTGTQGKTTTTQLIGSAVARAGLRAAVIGTMGTWIDGEPVGSALTTPEAPDLHALFGVMRERAIDVCAMEVSSHALVMGRVDGVVFDVAVFLNLGRDHLDFHSDVEDYFGAKAQLFTPARARRGLANADDPYGRRLARHDQIPTETFSTQSPTADWFAEIDPAESTPQGSTFDFTGPAGVRGRCHVGMAGSFNVTNALAALASSAHADVDLRAAADGIAAAGAVTGRMERIALGQDFSVIVDYAHKPDAVQATLEALRPVTSGRLVVVIGAGGDRDAGKRAIMGEIAATLADVVVVTDDNPRSEDPASIRADILAGARASGGRAELVEVGDRGSAIRRALSEARPGDTVLIAGKGHETGQEAGGTVLPFDDRAVSSDVLRELGAGVES
jgi:UDP-N-acetylmuramoyl-L-alanyl-D-glutamate--2,6-diaminopimelate ligase